MTRLTGPTLIRVIPNRARSSPRAHPRSRPIRRAPPRPFRRSADRVTAPTHHRARTVRALNVLNAAPAVHRPACKAHAQATSNAGLEPADALIGADAGRARASSVRAETMRARPTTSELPISRGAPNKLAAPDALQRHTSPPGTRPETSSSAAWRHCRQQARRHWSLQRGEASEPCAISPLSRLFPR